MVEDMIAALLFIFYFWALISTSKKAKKDRLKIVLCLWCLVSVIVLIVLTMKDGPSLLF